MFQKKSLVQSFDLCLWLDIKKDHTCVTCVNKVVVSCSYTSLTKSWNWLAIRYWGQLLCVYGSLWLVYNVNWTPFIARIEGWTFKLNKMYSKFGQSQTISKSRLGFFKKIKVKMYRRNFHAIGQLMVKSIKPKFLHISVYHYFFIYWDKEQQS